MWPFERTARVEEPAPTERVQSPIDYLLDAVVVALGAGHTAQVREICTQTIKMIDTYEPGYEIHTADTRRSVRKVKRC